MSKDKKDNKDDSRDSRRYLPVNDVNDPSLDDVKRAEDKDYWKTDDVDDDQRN